MRENRRWSSVNRTRRPFNCSLRTRFSSTRYSMTSCWWRLTHPARVTSSSRKGEGTGSAEYSDTTGGDLEPAAEEAGHHRRHFLVEQDEVAHDHRAVAYLLEGRVRPEGKP